MTDYMIDVYNPATGELIDSIPETCVEAVNLALENGHHAFSAWKKTSVYERAALLEKWGDLILRDQDEIAKIITLENGKPLKEGLGEVHYAVSFLTWFAAEAKRLYGRVIPASSTAKKIMVTQQGVGLVAAITPWNFPAAMMTRKAAPALAAGCTFIIKPAEETPLTMLKLVELAHEAGIPTDVLQCINGRGHVIGPLLTASHYVRKITFTGSTNVGKILMRDSASTVKTVSMELGGHAPFIVCADADLDHAVTQAIASKFRNAGQTCVCANRFLVHRSVIDAFTEKFAEAVSQLVVGNGLAETTDIGPLINEAGFLKVKSHIEDAVSKGARIVCGGEMVADEERGVYFVHPTILSDVNDSMIIMQEETFGPVAPIVPFDTLDEAIAVANGTPYGLAAYFFTENYRDGHYLNDALDFGIIGWNDGLVSTAQAPFGGMKESGVGREGGIEGIDAFLETKYLSIGGL